MSNSQEEPQLKNILDDYDRDKTKLENYLIRLIEHSKKSTTEIQDIINSTLQEEKNKCIYPEIMYIYDHFLSECPEVKVTANHIARLVKYKKNDNLTYLLANRDRIDESCDYLREGDGDALLWYILQCIMMQFPDDDNVGFSFFTEILESGTGKGIQLQYKYARLLFTIREGRGTNEVEKKPIDDHYFMQLVKYWLDNNNKDFKQHVLRLLDPNQSLATTSLAILGEAHLFKLLLPNAQYDSFVGNLYNKAKELARGRFLDEGNAKLVNAGLLDASQENKKKGKK